MALTFLREGPPAGQSPVLEIIGESLSAIVVQVTSYRGRVAVLPASGATDLAPRRVNISTQAKTGLEGATRRAISAC
jgi:hypothetical protein